MGIAVLIGLSLGLTRLWVVDGPRLPALFIVLLIIGWIASSHFVVGGYLFMSYQALLAIAALLIGQYKASS